MTYRPPSMKVPMIMIFLPVETFKFQSTGTGRISITKSVTTFMTPAANTTAVKLMHLPSMLLFHCAAGGTHWRMSRNKKAIVEVVMKAPLASKAILKLRCGKRRL